MHFSLENRQGVLDKSEQQSKPYIGRYAPSPSGRLHYGNLRTALLSWLHARLNNGKWLLRFDDIDSPRVVAGSDQQIMEDLVWLGLDWDGQPYYQSEQLSFYQQKLDELIDDHGCYECFCSRKDIQQAASAPHGKMAVYPGTCRHLSQSEKQDKASQKHPAIRLQVENKTISFEDGILGSQTQNMATECGDFVIKRADGLFAYQFAVVLDDIAQGVTDVVRGADLLDSSPRQLYLFERFGANFPRFWHVPLVMTAKNQRMAKRNGSSSVADWQMQGGNSKTLIAKFANELGLLFKEDGIDSISPQQLLKQIDLDLLTK